MTSIDNPTTGCYTIIEVDSPPDTAVDFRVFLDNIQSYEGIVETVGLVEALEDSQFSYRIRAAGREIRRSDVDAVVCYVEELQFTPEVSIGKKDGELIAVSSVFPSDESERSIGEKWVAYRI